MSLLSLSVLLLSTVTVTTTTIARVTTVTVPVTATTITTVSTVTIGVTTVSVTTVYCHLEVLVTDKIPACDERLLELETVVDELSVGGTRRGDLSKPGAGESVFSL